MADRAQRRAPALLALLLILGAAGTAAASAMTWWTERHHDNLSGTVVTKAAGAQVDSLLIPIALVALAGFGAAVATKGLIRRFVGSVLVAGGAWAAVSAVSALFTVPTSLRTDLSRPAESSDPPQLQAIGPLLGALGALLVVAAGVLLLAGVGARRSLGTRYDAPSAGKREGRTGDQQSDPDVAAAWWKALDAGEDPTRSGTNRSGEIDPGVSDGAIRGG